MKKGYFSPYLTVSERHLDAVLGHGGDGAELVGLGPDDDLLDLGHEGHGPVHPRVRVLLLQGSL